MSDKILYTGIGDNPFKGLEGMPEFPILEGTDAYLEHSQKLIFTLEQQVESIKSNAPLVLNPEDHPDLEFVTQWVHTKLAILKPGDIFDLPVGYEFKKEYRAPCIEAKDCLKPENGWKCMSVCKIGSEPVIRIVKTEVKEELIDAVNDAYTFDMPGMR